ncbi:unnamed protein product [Prunus armeniaca]
MTIAMYITVLAILIVVCQNSWPTVFLLIPLIWLNIWYQGYYLASSRELTRLNSITKAPVIHHFSESISGVMTIHSCRMQNMFSKKMLNGLTRIYVWISTTMGPMSGLVSVWRRLGSLERCQLKDEVAAKPDKLNSLVADDGDNWSMGQTQLLCLGRVMLKHNRLLFMDEVTASIDSQTDAVTQRIIREDFVALIGLVLRASHGEISWQVCVASAAANRKVKERAVEIAKAIDDEDGLIGALNAFHRHFPHSKSADKPESLPARSGLFSISRCFGYSHFSTHPTASPPHL